MKKVGVVGYAQHKILPNAGVLNEVEELYQNTVERP